MKALILCGDGINCENECSKVIEEVGFISKSILLNELVNEDIFNYDLLVFPGGFSFADDLGSGKVYAAKLKAILGDQLSEFIKKKGLIIGICNGFQILVELGVFSDKEKLSLTNNRQNQFMNKWVKVKVNQQLKSPWLRGFGHRDFYLPIRHAEGRLVVSDKNEFDDKNVALTYVDDVNGSYQQIAGLCDPTGHIFGLMPHPEAAFRKEQIALNDKTTYGKQFFENAYNYIKEMQ